MQLKIPLMRVFLVILGVNFFLPLETGTTVPMYPPFEKELIHIVIGSRQGGVVMINNTSAYRHNAVFVLPEDSIIKRIVLRKGKNFLAIPRYAKTDSAYLAVYSSPVSIGVDTVFAITSLVNGYRELPIGGKKKLKGAGYPGIFNIINSNEGVDELTVDTLGLPLSDAKVFSPFGRSTKDTKTKKVIKGEYHRGTDFIAVTGTKVFAILPGTVQYVVSEDRLGKAVLVSHGADLWSAYFHLSSYNVKVGDTLALGQMLGKSGNTGVGTGPHLHVSTFVGKTPVDFEQIGKVFSQ